MTRRSVLLLPLTAAALPAGTFRYSLCNETLAHLAFGRQCRMARKIGYTGLEVMPGTLAPDPAAISAASRAEFRRMMSEEGIAFAGLHNLLSAPAGLHATTADDPVYRRTWDHVLALIDLCGDLGGGLMVFGSGKQRNAPPGMDRETAVDRLVSGLGGVAGHAQACGVTILIEPLAPHLSNIVNTLESCAQIVRRIGSPAIRTIFDVHNTAGETMDAAALIERYGGLIRHVHLNEMDGKRPGAGGYDFLPLLKALRHGHYRGWLSMEIFDFAPSREGVATRALEYMKEQERRT